MIAAPGAGSDAKVFDRIATSFAWAQVAPVDDLPKPMHMSLRGWERAVATARGEAKAGVREARRRNRVALRKQRKALRERAVFLRRARKALKPKVVKKPVQGKCVYFFGLWHDADEEQLLPDAEQTDLGRVMGALRRQAAVEPGTDDDDAASVASRGRANDDGLVMRKGHSHDEFWAEHADRWTGAAASTGRAPPRARGAAAGGAAGGAASGSDDGGADEEAAEETPRRRTTLQEVTQAHAAAHRLYVEHFAPVALQVSQIGVKLAS